MQIDTGLIQSWILKIFDFLNKGYELFYFILMKICPDFLKETLLSYENMAYVFYGFMLFAGISLVFKMRKKIFWVLVIFAAVMVAANYYIL